jgi:hypothetical protein
MMRVQLPSSTAATTGSTILSTATNAITRAVFVPRPIMMMALVGRNNGMMMYMSTTTTTDGKPLWSSHHKHFPLPNAKGTVIYTETDEAPALATYSLYPVVSKVRGNLWNVAIFID